MPRYLTASVRESMIRLAASLPVGSPERKALLNEVAGSSKKASSIVNKILTAYISSLRIHPDPKLLFHDSRFHFGDEPSACGFEAYLNEADPNTPTGAVGFRIEGDKVLCELFLVEGPPDMPYTRTAETWPLNLNPAKDASIVTKALSELLNRQDFS